MIAMLTSEIVGTELLHELWNKRAGGVIGYDYDAYGVDGESGMSGSLRGHHGHGHGHTGGGGTGGGGGDGGDVKKIPPIGFFTGQQQNQGYDPMVTIINLLMLIYF